MDSKSLMAYNFEDPLNHEETTTLNKICMGSNSIIKKSVLQPLFQKAHDYARLSVYDRQLLSLESAVLTRLKDGLIRQKKYSLLLDWISKYRKLNIRILAPNHTNFPLEKTKSLDTMFELWVLFEILDYLIEYQDAEITRIQSNRFNVKVKGLDFDLCYQPKKYNGWALQGEPDYSIEVNGKSLVIMDAKNWADRKDEAIYKMLGYLNNFDGTLGILIFPNNVFLSDNSIMRGEGLTNHSNQTIFNCVLPLSGNNRIKRKKESIKTLFDLIVTSVSQ